MEAEKLGKSIQEQASAAWIDYLNQERINLLVEKLKQQDVNLENALERLADLKKAIAEEVINTNRGGDKGMHGFIAERMQVFIENARNLVIGEAEEYILVDDNGPVDYIKAGVDFQQKFVQRHLGLDAVLEHSKKYPDYLKNGGKYHIPKDYYEKIVELLSLSEEEAAKLTGQERRLWLYLKKFFEEHDISLSDIEPAVVNYTDAQMGKADETIENEKENIKAKDKEERDKAYQKSKPTLKEGVKAAGVSALLEGGMTFCLSVYKKRKAGKKFSDFDEEDWREVGIDTVKGTEKGAIRGGTVYALSNFTATPAAVASGLVTAIFGVCVEADKYQNGDISEEDFMINSEIMCLDVAISTLSSVLGQYAIPIPILGAIVGNVVGSFMYDIAKQYLKEDEKKLICAYNENINKLNKFLDERYQIVIALLAEEFNKYKSLVELAFSEDVNKAFEGSIGLAKYVGVAEEKILKSNKEIEAYFLN